MKTEETSAPVMTCGHETHAGTNCKWSNLHQVLPCLIAAARKHTPTLKPILKCCSDPRFGEMCPGRQVVLMAESGSEYQGKRQSTAIGDDGKYSPY